MGLILCRRGRSGLRLTEEGRQVYDKVKRLMATLDQFDDRMRSQLTGTLSIGLTDNTITDGNARRHAVIRRFCDAAPDVALSLVTRPPHELLRVLISGQLHLAIAGFPRTTLGLDFTALYTETHDFFCGCAHPLFTVPEADISTELVRRYGLSGRWRRLGGALNTNSGYLHPEIVRLAERPQAILPPELDTLMFVCTGSEANDMAVRLSRAATGQQGVIITGNSYHGNTTTVAPLSLIDYDLADKPDWVATMPPPNLYRGLYQDAGSGPRYAAHVGQAANQLRAAGPDAAALMIDSIFDANRSLMPPEGDMATAYATIHRKADPADKAGAVGEKGSQHPRHLLRSPTAAKRRDRLRPRGSAGRHIRLDLPRRHRIRANTPRAQIAGKAFREAHHPRLGRGIGHAGIRPHKRIRSRKSAPPTHRPQSAPSTPASGAGRRSG